MKSRKLMSAIVLLSFLAGCKKYAEPETFIIPDDFTGAVVVVYNQENGQEKKYKNKRRVYEIPENGILETQFEKPKGVLSQEFYFEKNDSDEIKRIVLDSSPNDSQIYILDSYDGQSSILPEGGIKQGSTDDYPKIKWSYFTLGKPSANRDSLRGLGNQKVKQVVKEKQRNM